MKTLDEALSDPKMRLYLQRRYRLEQLDDLYAPKVILSQASDLLSEAETGLSESFLVNIDALYGDYVDRRRLIGP